MGAAERSAWTGFVPPAQLDITHPWLARYCDSAILQKSSEPSASNLINTADHEVYGDPACPILFRIGNGGAGYTGILKELAEHFIQRYGGGFRIAWVANHSRHTQAALLADVVQVALTYEPQDEELAIRKGWCRRICRAFNDHFVLVGPKHNPAGVQPHVSISEALQQVKRSAEEGGSKARAILFQTRGDGSATFLREQTLWRDAGFSFLALLKAGTSWLHIYPGTPPTPYTALLAAHRAGAYVLTDRAIFLTATREHAIPNYRVFVEGGKALLNPCSALVNTKTPEDKAANQAAVAFAEWLGGEEGKRILWEYGRGWEAGLPLFTDGWQAGFEQKDALSSLVAEQK